MGMIDGDWRHCEVIIIHPDDDYIFYVDEDIPTFLSNTQFIISIIPKTSPNIPNNPQKIPKKSPNNPQKKNKKKSPTIPQKKTENPQKKPTVTKKKTYGYGSKPIHIFKGE